MDLVSFTWDQSDVKPKNICEYSESSKNEWAGWDVITEKLVYV